MSIRGGVYLLLFAYVLAGTSNSQTTPPDTQLAVEIPNSKGLPPSYVTLNSTRVSSSLFYDPGLRRVTGGDPNRRQPSALKLEYTVEGGVVQITALVFFGEFDRQTTPVSVYKLPSEKVGVYSARLDQSVTLFEMEQFGLEPLTLRIVPAPPPPSVRPLTLSKAPSVQIEIVGEDRSFYKVVLHNLSAKGVTAFSLDMPEKDGNHSQSDRNNAHDLITPGGTYQVQFGIPHSGSMATGKFVENPPPLQLVLEAAFFTDGSYEGDTQAAAEMAAQRLGSQVQRQQVDHVVTAILADAQSDDRAKVARIRSGVAQLSEEPDPQMVERVQTEFPGLSDMAVRRLKISLGLALKVEKQSVELGLKDYERSQGQPGGFALAAWWHAFRKP
ncbi:exported hypothetical protein [Candidatus Sulfopaludibacter sp. SbA3]|nr:exported hypothetical protein [Candidatus Sulfopaludibacter sp. SbA3]